MPRRARIHFVSLRSSLVNLPISIYGPLLERSVRPQSLAIHLKLVHTPEDNRDVEAYVGWTGMASASSLAHFQTPNNAERTIETIEIDPQYSQALGLIQGDVVEVGLLYDLAMAKSVAAEPLTSDDWEIIEIHASHVESTLLSQVRVAKAGQEIDVWVMGRTRIRLRVGSVNPKIKESPLLLTTNTEVIIAPKPHQSERRADNARETKRSLTQNDDSIVQSAAKPSIPYYSEVVRVLPHRISTIPLPEYSGQELVAFVSPSTLAKLSVYIGRLESGCIKCRKFTFERLAPPADPLSSSSSGAPPLAPRARVLKPDSRIKIPADTGHVLANTIFVGPLTGLPESHISFPAVPGSLESWDLLVLYPSTDDEEIVLDETPGEGAPVEPSFPSVHSKLAGIDEILQRCIDFCMFHLIYHAYTDVIHGVSSLLVTGRSGTGKTSIVEYIAKVMQADQRTFTHTHFVDVARYTEQSLTNIKSLFQYWFDKAAWHKPTILILDNLDKLLGPEVEHADSFRTRHITELFLSLYSSSARTAMPNSRGILLLATATSSASLHPLINSSHLFQEVINVKPPNTNARKDMIENIVLDRLNSTHDIQLDLKSPPNYMALATQTEGYAAKDLQDLVGRAIHQVAIRAAEDMQPALLSSADFTIAQVDFIPLSLRDVKMEKSEVAWSDIGLHETRKILRETLEWPTKYGPIFAQSPLRLRSGLLLYGHPGCGKTLLASAVAKECGLNFISVKGPEILNKYIGASEKSVRDLFERASAAKPCVLFFDEFDSIAPKRGHDSTGVTDRVVNQMLTQMDGAEGLEGVYVLAATSRPDLIDSALLRPGRLDKSLLCGMPNYNDRKEILSVVGRRVSLAPSVDLDEFAAATDGFSGADLQALIYNAHLDVIHTSRAGMLKDENAIGVPAEDQQVEFTVLGGSLTNQHSSKAEKSVLEKRILRIKHANQEKSDVQRPPVVQREQYIITAEHLQRVLKTTRPSVSMEERLRLDRIYRTFVSDRSGDLPVPPDAGGIGNRVSLM